MKRIIQVAAASGLFLLSANVLHAQGMLAPSQGTPRISHVMPMGGQAGTTFELRVSGQGVTDVEGLHFNFAGVKVESGTSEATPVDPKGKGKGKPLPPLTTHTFKVTLPGNAPLGIQDVRLVTKAGVSNPRAFVVSDHKEFVEQEPNNDVKDANRIDLPGTANGVIGAPADVDYYVFAGKKGQRVIVSCLTTSIDSRLPAEVQVFSAAGSRLGGNVGYSHNDALVDVVLPADGDYHVRVCAFTYLPFGIDNYYRLTVSTAPWIDAVFPPVVEAGKDTQVTLYGRNLPGGKIDPMLTINERPLETATVTIKASNDPKAAQRLAYTGFVQPFSSMLDGFDYRAKNGAGSSNPYLVQYAQAPVVVDNGANDEQAKAQKIPVPCVIAGRIEKRGDRDWYAFSAKKGQVLHIEAFGERLGSPLDLIFQVRSEAGLISEQDENPEILAPQFFTRSDDPAKYRFAAPADGTYYLLVWTKDNFTQFGPRHLYTVNITTETPDFRLVAMPLATLAPEGNTVYQSGGAAFTVYVWRSGGFNDEITLSGVNLPPGVGVQPQTISASQKVANFVVHADAKAANWTGGIQVVGTATVKGQKLVRDMRGATISWAVQQPNVPTITRLDRELVVAVRDKAPYTLALATQKLVVKQGDKISIPVKLVAADGFKTAVQVNAVGGPPGLIAPVITLSAGTPAGNATLDIKGGTQILPGNYTVFLRGQTNPINPKNPAPGKNAPPNIMQTSMPVTVTIVPKQLGKLTAAPANAKVALGKEVEITVRMARQFDLPASFKVEAIFGPNVKGVSAKEATIKADEDEVKLTISVSPQAQAGVQQSITIRATAMFNESIPIVHEAKVTLTIAK